LFEAFDFSFQGGDIFPCFLIELLQIGAVFLHFFGNSFGSFHGLIVGFNVTDNLFRACIPKRKGSVLFF
jgi:hypothetical protein